MVKKFKTFGPQLVFAEQTAGSVVVTNEQKLSLYKKSQKSGISTDILEEVYRRGYHIWNESFGQTAEQFAFDRVNSFIAGGFAAELDEDLMINEGKKFIIYKRTDAASGGHQVPNLTFDKKDDAHSHIEKLAPGDYEVRKGWAGGTKTSRAELAKKIGMNEEVKEPTGDLKSACWKGYTAVGMKMKNGRKVPNCVPVKEEQINETSPTNKVIKNVVAQKIGAAARQSNDPKHLSVINTGMRTSVADKIRGRELLQGKDRMEEQVKLHTGKHFKTTETVEKQSKNPNDPDSRFDGTKSAKNVYQKATPGQPITETNLKGDSMAALADRAKVLDQIVAQQKEAQTTAKDTPKTSVSQAAERRQFSKEGEVITNVGSRGEKSSTTIPNQVTKKQPAMTNALTTIKKVVKEYYEIEENWQNKKYKNPEGGLTRAGVMAYRRENPGSKLKTAVTTPPSKLKPGSKAANRRKSFCARMGGMKKRLTSAKTARDPDSRINKALRKWNC